MSMPITKPTAAATPTAAHGFSRTYSSVTFAAWRVCAAAAYPACAMRALAAEATFSSTERVDGPPNESTITGIFPNAVWGVQQRTFNGVALGTAVDKVSAVAKQVLPADVSASFSGNAQAFQSSLQNLSLLLLVAIATVLATDAPRRTPPTPTR